MLEQVAACTPALTGFVAKCYGDRLASVFFRMNSGGRTKLECSRGVQQDDAFGPAMLCLPLWPVLTRVREEYESSGVEAYAYLDDIAIAADEISPRTVGVVPFLERELTARGIHLNLGKTVALTPKELVPAPEEISLSAAGVRIANEGGIKVVGVPVGTDEFEIDNAIGIVRDGGGQPHSYRLSGAANGVCRTCDGSKAVLVDGQIMAQYRFRNYYYASWNGGGIVVLRGGLHGGAAYTVTSPTCASQLFKGGRRFRNVVGRSEQDVRIDRELGGYATCDPG